MQEGKGEKEIGVKLNLLFKSIQNGPTFQFLVTASQVAAQKVKEGGRKRERRREKITEELKISSSLLFFSFLFSSLFLTD